jgi:HlyD family secretion protein
MTRTVSALALLAAGCFSGYDPGPAGHLHALTVHRGTFVSDLVLTGQLEAARGEAIAVPPLPAWQTSIKWIAADGSEVSSGDRVAELDSGAFVLNLDSKRQAVIQARQELAQKNAEWAADLAEKALDAEKKRVDYQKARLEVNVPPEIVSGREYADRQVKYKRASVELAKASDVLLSIGKGVNADRANLQLALGAKERDLQEAEHAIEALTLRASRSGVVVVHDHPWEGRKLQQGDGVWVGFPLALIPEPSSMEVTAALADVDDGKIALGMPAAVVLDAYPSLSFPGKIADISAVAQESAKASLRRAFRVVVKLDRIDFARMRPGLSARVTVRRATQSAVLLAPRNAIDASGNHAQARLADGKNIVVRLGPCNNQECVILDGLHEGDSLAPGLSPTATDGSHG